MVDLRPHIAELAFKDEDCHGTAWLISDRLALTAAHCIGARKGQVPDPRPLALRFLHPKHCLVDVGKVLHHAGNRHFYYDVALLELATPVAQPPIALARPLKILGKASWDGYGFPTAHPGGMPINGKIDSLHGNVEGWPAMQLKLQQGGHGFMEGISGGPVVIENCAVGVIRYNPPKLKASTIYATSMAEIAKIYPEVAALLPPPVDTDELDRLLARLRKYRRAIFANVLYELTQRLDQLPQDMRLLPDFVSFVGTGTEAPQRVLAYLSMFCPTGLTPLAETFEKMKLPALGHSG